MTDFHDRRTGEVVNLGSFGLEDKPLLAGATGKVRKAAVQKHSHNWEAVGGDNYGPEYDMCTQPGCPAERHLEYKVDKAGYPVSGSYKQKIYANGKAD